jgi:predicted nicotinamide N-methyase
VQVVTLPQIGDISIVCKTKRDISVETPLDKRDDESLGWRYWDRIWPSEVALSEFLIHQFFPTKLKGVKALEIGCGTGLAGFVAAELGASTMFSDMVPITLQAVKETCQLNHLNNFDTCMLDWSEKIESKERYDLVLGSEVFYDEEILADISDVLEQVLAPGGKGIFCDPNRLGLDTIERGFQEKFNVSIEKIPLHWPPRKGNGVEKMVYRYELTCKDQASS